MSNKTKAKKKNGTPRGRKYEVTRPLNKDELGGQELVVFNTIKRLSNPNVHQIHDSAREQLKSKSKNLESCVSWYINHLKNLKLVRVAK